MIYQLSWATLPGLRGLGCSSFRATPTAEPDRDRGVAVEFTSESDRDAFLARLEKEFAAQRFSNAASAFEAVKAIALEWAANSKKS